MLFTMIAVVLATHGEEPSREEKFRGALAQVEVRGTTALTLSPREELDALYKNRPSLVGAGAALGTGLGLTLVGGGLFALPWLIRSFALSLRESGVWWMLFSGSMLGIGVLTGLIAGMVMAVLGDKLTRIDRRIRMLEAQAPRPPTTAQFSLPPHLVLARF